MLTEAQQQLATDNHNLIYSFLKKYNLKIDDWYDVAAIGFCKAARDYDASRDATFSSCAYFYMYREVLHYKSADQKETRNQSQIYTHLESPLNGCNDFKLEDCMSYNSDFSNPEVQELIKNFNSREKLCLSLWLQKAPQEVIQKAIGHGRGTVYNTRTEMKRKLLRCGVSA